MKFNFFEYFSILMLDLQIKYQIQLLNYEYKIEIDSNELFTVLCLGSLVDHSS